MSTTIAEASPTESKSSPFNAALENAFNGDNALPVETESKSEEPAKVSKESTKSVPDALFKRPDSDTRPVEESLPEKTALDEIADAVQRPMSPRKRP